MATNTLFTSLNSLLRDQASSPDLERLVVSLVANQKTGILYFSVPDFPCFKTFLSKLLYQNIFIKTFLSKHLYQNLMTGCVFVYMLKGKLIVVTICFPVRNIMLTP